MTARLELGKIMLDDDTRLAPYIVRAGNPAGSSLCLQWQITDCNALYTILAFKTATTATSSQKSTQIFIPVLSSILRLY